MKKITSFLLILTFLLSMIYVPAFTVSVSAEEKIFTGGVSLQEGHTDYDLTGFTAISTAQDFVSKVKVGGKYYLRNSIDLTTIVDFVPLAGGNKSAGKIVFDGCGYTITTNKPLFEELPAGNSNSAVSEIRNVVIKGNIKVNSTDIAGYDNGNSAGALVGKTNGGIFRNIVNKATVEFTDSGTYRIGGLIGVVFNFDVILENCFNEGKVTGAVTKNSSYGIGGLVGCVAYNNDTANAVFSNCANSGIVQNSSNGGYAGGVLGVKYANTILAMINCNNKGLQNNSDLLNYGYSNANFTNVSDATIITSGEDFEKISGSGNYVILKDFTIYEQNTNYFNGKIWGNLHTITSTDGPIFGNAASATKTDINQSLGSEWIAISDTTGFTGMSAGKKYYLTESFTISNVTTGYVWKGGSNSASSIILDGCGHTITTTKMLIKELPGGSGSGSEIRNLNIDGIISYDTVNAAEATAGSIAALVGKANGGIFRNIVNRASVSHTNTTAENARVAGIIGSVHNSLLIMDNCSNEGAILGKTKDNGTVEYGVGGVIAYIGASTILYKCGSKSGTTITQNESSGRCGDLFAYAASNTSLIGCTNNGSLENTTPVTAIEVSTAEDFDNISGSANYVITNGFTINKQNDNTFTGTVYGLGYTITSTDGPIFGNAKAVNSKVKNLNQKIDGWTAISNATGFKAITNGEKYYLTTDIDLTASGVNFATLAGGTNTAAAIVLDGCGYEITTNKMLIEELPGGGSFADGTHSIIRNLIISGSVAPSTTTETSGYSVGALVGKANGGIFKNITNNANVTAPGNAKRAGGIIGSVFNDNIIIENCVNNGAVTGNIGDQRYYGIGGILGLIGYNENSNANGAKAIFIDCVNYGNITNNSTHTTHSYAGGIFGVKYVHATQAILVDCKNTGTIKATAYYGNYYANSTYQNAHVLKSIPIANVDDFMAIQGKHAYRLTADITLSAINGNDFSGIIIGDGHSITTNDVLFANPTTYEVYDVETDVKSLNIDGRALSSFAVVAPTDTNSTAAANLIVNHINTSYGSGVSRKTPSDNYKGNAIFINQNNTYDNTRYGFDYEITEEGYMHVYLDETSDNIQSLASSFIAQKLTTNEASYDFFDNFGQKRFTYVFDSGLSQGITLDESKDNVRLLAAGVKYIERTYLTSTGISIKAYMVVLKADAKAHLEIAAAPMTSVNCALDGNSNCDCDGKHVAESAKKNVVEFAQELDAQDKNVLASMNASYFMLDAKCNTPWGMQIVNGTVNREPRQITDSALGNRWFGVTKSGTPVMGDVNAYNNTYKGQIQNGVGGRYYCIKNGLYVQAGSINGNTDARTAIAHNAAGDIILLAVAGNNDNKTNHPGVTIAETGQIFMDMDMDITYALGLDGGGSTALAYKNTEGEYIVSPQYGATANTTVSMRKLADAIMIVAD